MLHEEIPSTPPMPHHLTVEDRCRMQMGGVAEVIRFDEQEAIIRTSGGILHVLGRQLHVVSMSIETGDLSLGGVVDSLEYQDEQPRGGLFGRLWR